MTTTTADMNTTSTGSTAGPSLVAAAWLSLVHPAVVLWPALALMLLSLCGYRLALPRPIPGIPYNKGIGILGDLPEMIAERRAGRSPRRWVGDMSTRHNAVLCQFFPRPLARPTLILTDHREITDVLFRRNREFDRSSYNKITFGAVTPDQHLAMQTSDPRFKGNKELIKGLMAPAFLTKVAVPLIYQEVLRLVELWSLKMAIAKGRPFDAFHDIHNTVLDLVVAISFDTNIGTKRSALRASWDALFTADRQPVRLAMPANEEAAATFPSYPLPDELQALLTVAASITITLRSLMPSLEHWIAKNTWLRRWFTIKQKFVWGEIDKAVARMTTYGFDKNTYNSALDYMVLREVAIAEKEGRKPGFRTRRMHDEIFGLLAGGHETTSTTLGWLVKFLSDNSEVQAKLRRQLRTAYAEAAAEGRQPTASEITQTGAPYLDAFLEESLRKAQTLPVAQRQAVVDTTILGQPVPKGTVVFMSGLGPSFVAPHIPVSEHLRSEGAGATKNGGIPYWGDATIGLFDPERWLKPRVSGAEGETSAGARKKAAAEVASPGAEEFDNVDYDPQAGPMLAFGGGPRGCFGKRLAYLVLRMATVQLVWNFEFSSCGPALSSYDATEEFTAHPKQCFVKLTRL